MKSIIVLLTFIVILESIQALTCNNDIDCKESPNTFCRNLKDNYNANFLDKNGVCKAIIHGSCKKRSDCGVTNSLCGHRTKMCVCRKSFYSSIDKITCYKFAEHLNDTCVHTYGCKAIANSVCSKDFSKCICPPSHTEVAGKCLGLFRAACSNDADCDSFYRCQSKVCMCRENVTIDDELKCLDSLQDLKPPICTPEICIDDIGSPCITDMDCGIENAICYSDTCQCKADYHYSSSSKKCQKVQ